jgi:hypothetical protein
VAERPREVKMVEKSNAKSTPKASPQKPVAELEEKLLTLRERLEQKNKQQTLSSMFK